MKSARGDRTNAGRLVKALVRLTEVMAKFPNDAAKISKEEEKVRAWLVIITVVVVVVVVVVGGGGGGGGCLFCDLQGSGRRAYFDPADTQAHLLVDQSQLAQRLSVSVRCACLRHFASFLSACALAHRC